jgi:hypothetical protein
VIEDTRSDQHGHPLEENDAASNTNEDLNYDLERMGQLVEGNHAGQFNFEEIDIPQSISPFTMAAQEEAF